MKSRKQKEAEYKEKYSGIPLDFGERLSWMVDALHLSESKMDEIIERKRHMEYFILPLEYTIILYEDPEGMPRPRFRLINKSNYANAAIQNPQFIHVYSPTAGDDFRYMRRLQGEELYAINGLIQTPAYVDIRSYFKTPSAISASDKILCELGYIPDSAKPDWDNIGKKYCDMNNHNVWLDDSLIYGGNVWKFFSMLPRVEINIKYFNFAPAKFQYDKITKRKDYDQSNPISYLNQKGVPINDWK